MKALIIADEPLAVERLQRLLQETGAGITVCGTAQSISSAVQLIRTVPDAELIFMDIELSDGLCFSIFEQVQVNCAVIFTTSYAEYALRAFDANSIDYLLKQVRKEDLEHSLEKYRRMQQHFSATVVPEVAAAVRRELEQQQQYPNTILVNQGQKIIPVDTADIAYFFVEGRLSFIITRNNMKYATGYTLDEIETMVDPALFCRANRAFIVHRGAVVTLHKTLNGKLRAMLVPPSRKELVISKEKAKSFKEWLGR